MLSLLFFFTAAAKYNISHQYFLLELAAAYESSVIKFWVAANSLARVNKAEFIWRAKPFLQVLIIAL